MSILNDNERVSVHLKTLVELVNKASRVSGRNNKVRAGQSGEYISRFKGRGMEFDETRVYQPGDDIRSIDWRVTARTNKTQTKIFCEERERPVFISVDSRRTMQFATRGVFKSVQAAKIAALLAWSAQIKGDRIGGQVFTQDACQEFKPATGKRAVLHFFNALVNPQQLTHVEMSLELVFARLVQHVRPGSLVYVISDFRGLNEAVEKHLSKLVKHCEVVLIHTYDQLEASLPVKGRYRFTDGKQECTVDTGDKKRVLGYQQQFQYRQQTLRKLSLRWRVNLLECKTTDDPIEVLR